MLRDGALTAWKPDGEGWRRTSYSGVRVEDSSGSRPTAAGSQLSCALKAWLFTPAGIAPGDYVVGRACGGDEPPADARRVESVAPYTLSGRPHHVEVTAR